MINRDDVVMLAATQVKLDWAQQELRERRAWFDDANKNLIEEVRLLSTIIEEAKARITPGALEEFEQSGEKKLLGGVGIREVTNIDYSADEALTWAKEKELFLALDIKAFEKAAPSLGLPFVTVSKKPTMTFPKEVKL